MTAEGGAQFGACSGVMFYAGEIILILRIIIKFKEFPNVFNTGVPLGALLQFHSIVMTVILCIGVIIILEKTFNATWLWDRQEVAIFPLSLDPDLSSGFVGRSSFASWSSAVSGLLPG